jgi:hypothetical protein
MKEENYIEEEEIKLIYNNKKEFTIKRKYLLQENSYFSNSIEYLKENETTIDFEKNGVTEQDFEYYLNFLQFKDNFEITKGFLMMLDFDLGFFLN